MVDAFPTRPIIPYSQTNTSVTEKRFRLAFAPGVRENRHRTP
jgi:hypothetical protein